MAVMGPRTGMHTVCARMGPLIHTEEQTPGMCVGTGRIRVSGALSPPLGGGGRQRMQRFTSHSREEVRFLTAGLR